MKLFVFIFEPLNRWLWSFLCKSNLILFCSGPDMPDPIDPGKSMGQYLFGKKEFKSAQGVTDPLLQGRLLEAEGSYRPLYTALELADIQTMAQGRDKQIANPAYEGIQKEIEFARRDLDETKINKKGKEVSALGPSKRKKAEARIKALERSLERLSPTLEPQEGLFDLLEDQSRRAGDLQREQLGIQRTADVEALKLYAPQVVQANRDADPYSTALAEQATKNAVMQAASAAESALQSSGLDNLNAEREAASAAEQELNKVGMSLSDLSPTEQEAILSGQGMEFASSTGELSALEKRRAQQSSREASVARGRGMDQSAVYGEMEARMAEELNKREREIALGAGLLGQESQMRLSRLGKGASILGQTEAMDAQRRRDQLQRQQFGASSLGQAEAMNTQRRLDYRQNLAQAFDMNRALAGDAGSIILGRPSASIGLGSQMLSSAQRGAEGQMGPQLFDGNAGLNMALQQRGQDMSFQGMQAQADASSQAGAMEAGAAVGTAAITAI